MHTHPSILWFSSRVKWYDDDEGNQEWHKKGRRRRKKECRKHNIKQHDDDASFHPHFNINFRNYKAPPQGRWEGSKDEQIESNFLCHRSMIGHGRYIICSFMCEFATYKVVLSRKKERTRKMREKNVIDEVIEHAEIWTLLSPPPAPPKQYSTTQLTKS